MKNENCEMFKLEQEACSKLCDCQYTEWAEWSECSKSCGSGETRRRRMIKSFSNISNCYLNLEEINTCNTKCCQIDGKFSSWSQWTECTSSCDSGIRKRYRSCDSPKTDCGGSKCEGAEEEIEICNTKPCGLTCENGKIFNNCSNKCDVSCSSLTCSQACHVADTCTPGCTCPLGTVENENKECVTVDKCLCNYEKKLYLPGQTLEKECQTW